MIVGHHIHSYLSDLNYWSHRATECMASQGSAPGEGADGYDAASILGNIRYRRILSILLERSEPVSSRELGVQIAAAERTVPPSTVSETACKSVQTALAHQYLPKLQRVGWVDRTPNGLTATTPQPIPTDAVPLPSFHDPEHPHWEPISALLSRPYRIVLVALLADRQQPLSLSQLAAQFRECEPPSWVRSLPGTKQLRVRLYHVDLPKLADVGLLAFDTAAQTVTHTALTSDIVTRPASVLD